MPLPRDPRWNDATYLRRRYIKDGVSLRELAAELHVTRNTLRGALDAAGIPRRPVGQPVMHREPYNEAWLTQHYVVEGLSLSQCGELLGCGPDPVRRALHRFGIPARRAGGRVRQRMLDDVVWLERKYLDEGWIQKDIARVPGSKPGRGAAGPAAARDRAIARCSAVARQHLSREVLEPR